MSHFVAEALDNVEVFSDDDLLEACMQRIACAMVGVIGPFSCHDMPTVCINEHVTTGISELSSLSWSLLWSEL